MSANKDIIRADFDFVNGFAKKSEQIIKNKGKGEGENEGKKNKSLREQAK